MHRRQREAIVGRAVADILARKVGKGNLHQFPARGVVGKGDGVALSVVAWQRGVVAIVDHVDKQAGAAALAVEPEGDAFVGAPVLGDPLRGIGILKAVNHDRPHCRGKVHLEDVVAVHRTGHRDGRRRAAGKEGRAAVAILCGEEADLDIVRGHAIGQRRFEVVDDR